MIDIVFPSGNEEEFIQMARRVGISKLCFLYTSVPVKTSFDFPVMTGLLCDEKNIQQMRGKADLLFIRSASRTVLEQSAVDCVFGLEETGKDYLHQRGSGFDHIMASVCAEKNITVVFDLSLLRRKPDVWMRMKQNMRLCKKYEVQMRVASFAKTPHQMISIVSLSAVEKELMQK